MIDQAIHNKALRDLHAVIDRRGTLREVSLAYVQHVLACFDGNKVHTAKQIGIDRRTIQRWLPRRP